MKMATAFTMEIDEPQDAVDEILEQIDMGMFENTNAVGIVACHPDFVNSGAVRKLCEALPFDIIGTSTLGCATNGAQSMAMLSFAVLYGDDVRFSTVMTGNLTEDIEGKYRAAYGSALSALGAQPSAILSFIPIMASIGTEAHLDSLEKVTGGEAPIFGTLASDQTTVVGLKQSGTISGNRYENECAALLLIDGDIDPVFFVTAVSEDKIQHRKAIVTDAQGNVLRGLNGMTPNEYLDFIGFDTKGNPTWAYSVPLMLDYMDGTKPAARAIYQMTPEGYAVCGSKVPLNAGISVANIDPPDILKTAGDTVQSMLDTGKRNGMMLFPCLSRNLLLGLDPLAEMEVVQDIAGGEIPFLMSYAGGEICPLYSSGGGTVNKMHNFSFVGMIF